MIVRYVLVDIHSHVSGFKSCLYLDTFSFVFLWLAENTVVMIIRTRIDVHLAVQEHILWDVKSFGASHCESSGLD